MILSREPGAVKRFRRTSWRFQQTFETPLKDLDRFVSVILSVHKITGGVLTIDEVVFEPKHLLVLMSKHSLPPQYGHDWRFEVTGEEQVSELLVAALSDWVDFLFVPSPKPFVIYADHDEYTTFYGNTKSNLTGIVSALSENGFKQVQNWERRFGSP
jgi:hypothetical protein